MTTAMMLSISISWHNLSKYDKASLIDGLNWVLWMWGQGLGGRVNTLRWHNNTVTICIPILYSSFMQSMAHPLLTQWAWPSSPSPLQGTWMDKTKLVECPAVDNVPARADVLYKGQSYTETGLYSDAMTGFSHTQGMGSWICLGKLSWRHMRLLSNLPPSIYNPYTKTPEEGGTVIVLLSLDVISHPIQRESRAILLSRE